MKTLVAINRQHRQQDVLCNQNESIVERLFLRSLGLPFIWDTGAHTTSQKGIRLEITQQKFYHLHNSCIHTQCKGNMSSFGSRTLWSSSLDVTPEKAISRGILLQTHTQQHITLVLLGLRQYLVWINEGPSSVDVCPTQCQYMHTPRSRSDKRQPNAEYCRCVIALS